MTLQLSIGRENKPRRCAVKATPRRRGSARKNTPCYHCSKRTLGMQGHQPEVKVPSGVQESEPSAEVSFLRLQAGDPTAVRLGNVALWINWATCTYAIKQCVIRAQVREAKCSIGQPRFTARKQVPPTEAWKVECP